MGTKPMFLSKKNWQRGTAEFALGLGISFVSVMTAEAVRFLTDRSIKQTTTTLNGIEGFYAAEIAMHHAISVPAGAGVQTLSNGPFVLTVPESPAQSPNPDGLGHTRFSIQQTTALGATNDLLPRVSRMAFVTAAGGRTCGYVRQIPNDRFKVCAAGVLVPTLDLKANGSDGPVNIPKNTAVSLSWTSSSTDTCTLNPGGFSGTDGSEASSPLAAATTTFTLSCTGPGGTATDTVVVNALDVKVDLKLNNSDGPLVTVLPGKPITLKWSAHNASGCDLGGVAVPDTGSKADAVFVAGESRVYTFTCTATLGGLVLSDTITATAKSCVPCSDPSVIRFEGIGTKGTTVYDQYWASHGVRFKLEDGRSPVLAEVNTNGSNAVMNGNTVAWLCQGCGKGNRKNRPADASTSQILEKYVIAIPGAFKDSGGHPPSLIIEYATPVAAASGFLVDVDQNEIWQAIPLDAKGKPLTAAQGCKSWAVHAPPKPKDGWNGRALQFDVSCDDQEIYKVRIEGDKNISIIGFAFDRFSPASKICSCP